MSTSTIATLEPTRAYIDANLEVEGDLRRERTQAIKRLGEIMVERAVISAAQLAHILEMQKALVISCPSCQTRYNTVMFNPGIFLPCHQCGTMIQIPERPALSTPTATPAPTP